MTINYFLLWVVGIGGISAFLRSQGRREFELVASNRAGTVTIFTLFIGLLVFPDYAGCIAAFPWVFGLLIPHILLNQIIASFSERKLDVGERLLKKANLLPSFLVPWRPLWMTLFQAERAFDAEDLKTAVNKYREVTTIPSLATLYSKGALLLVMGQWSDLNNYTKPLTVDSSNRPVLYLGRLYLLSLAGLGRQNEIRSAYQQLVKHFPYGSSGRELILTTALQFVGIQDKQYFESELKAQHEAPDDKSYLTPAVAIIGALLALPFVIEVFYPVDAFYEWGIFHPLPILNDGEWWRMITPTFLHAGLLHLSANLLGLIILGPFLERSLGIIRFIILFFISSIGGAALVLTLIYSMILEPALMVGASAGVMGIVGGYAALYLVSYLRSKELYHMSQLRSVIFIVLLQTLFDIMTPSVSFSAHFGGLITGFSISMVMYLANRGTRSE